jgi:aryl-alcohol dehydrogenase-like predicted oxidoreductase
MKYRTLGRTGFNVSEISFGAWAIGGSWGEVSDADSLAALHRSVDLGVNFIDTADVYGDGRSERLIAKLKSERKEAIYIATKAGRRLSPHIAAGYTLENLTAFVERSLKNLNADALDLLQLHCPPTKVYYRPEVFGALDSLVKSGKLRFYGVSVETVEEGLKAIEFPNVQSVQIIFNIFRQRPTQLFFPECMKRKVGILARVPLASGLLTGKLSRQTQYAADDHRGFNLDAAFKAVEELKALVPGGATMAQLALRWILMNPAVTCAIPGAKTSQQAEGNVAAADLPPLTESQMTAIAAIYDQRIRPLVHNRW